MNLKVWYPSSLKDFEYRYSSLLKEFQDLYPSATESNFIDHYLEYYRGFETSIKKSKENNSNFVASLSNLITNEFQGPLKKDLLSELGEAEIHRDNEVIKKMENAGFEYLNLIKWLAEKKENCSEPSEKKEANQMEGEKSFNTFESIFCIPENASLSLNALHQTEPPIVDGNNNYILGERQKGSITAWVLAMRKKSIIKAVKDEDLAPILNDRIKGLNLGLDGRTLRNPGTSSYNRYFSSFLNLLP